MQPLPPRNVCLRCNAALADGADVCPACGADPMKERQVWVLVAAAVNEMRWVFAAVLALSAVSSWLVWDSLTSHHLDGSVVAISGAIICGAMAALWLLAPRAPVVAAAIGVAIFSFDWLREIARDRVFALDPGPVLALRVIVMFALSYALRSALTARKLRASSRASVALAA